MQAGYRYDSDASAKDLKIKLRNKKRDKILYGAVFKTDYAQPSIGSIIQPPALQSTTQPQIPPAALPRPRFFDAIGSTNRIAVDAARSSNTPSGIRVSASNTPDIVRSVLGDLRADVIRSSNQSEFDALPSTTMSGKRVSAPSTPVISRELITTTLANLRKTPKSMPLAPKSTPLLTEFKSKVPVVKTIQDFDAMPALDLSSSPVSSDGSQFQSPVSSDGSQSQRTPPRYKSPQNTRIDSLEEMKPDRSLSPSSTSPTQASSTPSELDLKSREGANTIQILAALVLNRFNEKQKKNNLSKQQQVTISAYMSDGSVKTSAIKIIKKKLKTGDTYYLYPTAALDKGLTGVNKIQSLENAIPSNERREAKQRLPGTTTGLGIASDSDPAKIKSQRVVFKFRKDGSNLKRNQLYVMEPQLIRGHLRMYHRSGRPSLSRSNISPAFQRMITDIIERNTYEADDFSHLEPKEVADFNRFVALTMPIQPRGIDRLSNADSIWQMKKRYEVLVGELSAGNSGKLVRDEMANLLRGLIRLRAMSPDKGKQLIKELRDF